MSTKRSKTTAVNTPESTLPDLSGIGAPVLPLDEGVDLEAALESALRNVGNPPITADDAQAAVEEAVQMTLTERTRLEAARRSRERAEARERKILEKASRPKGPVGRAKGSFSTTTRDRIEYMRANDGKFTAGELAAHFGITSPLVRSIVARWNEQNPSETITLAKSAGKGRPISLDTHITSFAEVLFKAGADVDVDGIFEAVRCTLAEMRS